MTIKKIIGIIDILPCPNSAKPGITLIVNAFPSLYHDVIPCIINIVPNVATNVGIFTQITRNALISPTPRPTASPDVIVRTTLVPASKSPADRLHVS